MSAAEEIRLACLGYALEQRKLLMSQAQFPSETLVQDAQVIYDFVVGNQNNT